MLLDILFWIAVIVGSILGFIILVELLFVVAFYWVVKRFVDNFPSGG